MTVLSIILLAASLTVPADVVSVYDGDTIKVEALHWPGHTWSGSVRLLGVDTPELRGKCPEEKAAAIAAREFVKSILGIHVLLHDVKLGKYAGRVLASIQTETGVDLAEMLIEHGHARRYDGGARSGWCGE